MPATHAEVIAIVDRFHQAKLAEDAARARRIEIEGEIIAAVGFDLTRGSKTFEFADGKSSCKVTLTQPVNVTVDEEGWDNLRSTLPKNDPARLVFRQKWAVDAKEAVALMATEPAAYRRVAHLITSKPGKVSVDLKQLVVS